MLFRSDQQLRQFHERIEHLRRQKEWVDETAIPYQEIFRFPAREQWAEIARREIDRVTGTVATFAILVILILPMPRWLLDISLAFSITFSVLILMTALFIEKPLEFTSFPTILLLVTLFRLALNIASTRLILMHGAEGVEAAGRLVPLLEHPDPHVGIELPLRMLIWQDDGGTHVGYLDPRELPDRHSYRSYVDGIYMGYKWQCVEFARRWMYLNKGYIFDDVAMAYDIFRLRSVRVVRNNTHLPLKSFANGSKCRR